MTQALTLARPYARAAFGLSREGGRSAAWSQALPLLAALRYGPRLPTPRKWVVLWCVSMLASDAAQFWLRGPGTPTQTQIGRSSSTQRA